MPRKKPDLTPWEKEENRVDSIFAKLVYYNTWGENYVLRMKDNPATQRMVKCQDCGIILPRDVPRLSREGSWYRHGHLCMDCGQNELTEFVRRMENIKSQIEEHITLGKTLRDCSSHVATDPRYKEKLAMGKLLQVMRGKKQQ